MEMLYYGQDKVQSTVKGSKVNYKNLLHVLFAGQQAAAAAAAATGVGLIPPKDNKNPWLPNHVLKISLRVTMSILIKIPFQMGK